MIKAVQTMEAEGWEPNGGIAMTRDKDGFTVYAQAMVKVEPVEPICICLPVPGFGNDVTATNPGCPIHGFASECGRANAHLRSVAPELVGVLRELTEAVKGHLEDKSLGLQAWKNINMTMGLEYEQARALLERLELLDNKELSK